MAFNRDSLTNNATIDRYFCFLLSFFVEIWPKFVCVWLESIVFYFCLLTFWVCNFYLYCGLTDDMMRSAKYQILKLETTKMMGKETRRKRDRESNKKRWEFKSHKYTCNLSCSRFDFLLSFTCALKCKRRGAWRLWCEHITVIRHSANARNSNAQENCSILFVPSPVELLRLSSLGLRFCSSRNWSRNCSVLYRRCLFIGYLFSNFYALSRLTTYRILVRSFFVHTRHTRGEKDCMIDCCIVQRPLN